MSFGCCLGESESKLRDLFAEARRTAPCILFIDDIDAIVPRRDSSSRGMDHRLVAQMQKCLDDLQYNPASLAAQNPAPDTTADQALNAANTTAPTVLGNNAVHSLSQPGTGADARNVA